MLLDSDMPRTFLGVLQSSGTVLLPADLASTFAETIVVVAADFSVDGLQVELVARLHKWHERVFFCIPTAIREVIRTPCKLDFVLAPSDITLRRKEQILVPKNNLIRFRDRVRGGRGERFVYVPYPWWRGARQATWPETVRVTLHTDDNRIYEYDERVLHRTNRASPIAVLGLPQRACPDVVVGTYGMFDLQPAKVVHVSLGAVFAD